MWARLNGVFWAAFLLFSWTTASIVSGSIIERVRSGAFWLIAVMLGSVTWIIDAAWGWHPAGWMVQILGYHDAYASGVVHAIAGGTCLAVLINLGPRIGKFKPDGTPRNIPPQNPWLVCIGLFLIYTGFWGFYAACNIPIFDVQAGDGVFYSATNIYLQATTLSAITFNFIMALCGGLMAGYIVSQGRSVLDLLRRPRRRHRRLGRQRPLPPDPGHDHRRRHRRHHLQAALLGGAEVQDRRRGRRGRGARLCRVPRRLSRPGFCCGAIRRRPMPAGPCGDPWATVTPWGQFIGAVIMFWVLGFIPGYVLSWILKQAGLLRVPREVEMAGLDHHVVAAMVQEDDEFRAVLAQEAERHRLNRKGKGTTSCRPETSPIGTAISWISARSTRSSGGKGSWLCCAVIFWVGWHIVQIKMENAQLDEEAQKLRQSGDLKKAVEAEHSPSACSERWVGGACFSARLPPHERPRDTHDLGAALFFFPRLAGG